uniref:Progestin and adipoQ receptor family member VII, b n=1 Tax=Oncorhynchus tshawytscha TaxID=74940 RepID=A0AAZ3Q8T7_ONCTS
MATVVMEQIGRLFINAQPLRQISQLLESAFPTLPCTVKAHDVPWVFREPHIIGGYRQPDHSWRYYFLTLFQRHNEALNVWTHLLAAFIILVKCQELSETVDFHRDPHAQPVYRPPLSLHLLVVQCPGPPAQRQVQALPLHLLPGLCGRGHLPVWQRPCPLLLRHRGGLARPGARDLPAHRSVPGLVLVLWLLLWQVCQPEAAQVCPPGGSLRPGLLPGHQPSAAPHLQLPPAGGGCSNQAVAYHRYQVLFFLVSTYFFACPHPECWLPGRCDFIGQGHQNFHMFLVLCTLVQIEATRIDYIERRPLYERLHGNLAHDTVALSLPSTCGNVCRRKCLRKWSRSCQDRGIN